MKLFLVLILFCMMFFIADIGYSDDFDSFLNKMNRIMKAVQEDGSPSAAQTPQQKVEEDPEKRIGDIVVNLWNTYSEGERVMTKMDFQLSRESEVAAYAAIPEINVAAQITNGVNYLLHFVDIDKTDKDTRELLIRYFGYAVEQLKIVESKLVKYEKRINNRLLDSYVQDGVKWTNAGRIEIAKLVVKVEKIK